MAIQRKKLFPDEHAEHVLEYHRNATRLYRRLNRAEWTKKTREYYAKNKERMRGYQKQYIAKVKQIDEIRIRYTTRNKEYTKRLRMEALEKYGSRCQCCGESCTDFLAFDHVNNDGNVMRRLHGRTARSLYYWMKKNGYPDSIQILCHNCNMAKTICGTCPHQKGRVN